MENTSSYLRLMPISKEQINIFSQKLIDEILQGGNIDVLELQVRFKAISTMIEKVIKNKEVKDYILQESNLYNEKTFSSYGADVTKTNRSTYNYAHCNDDIYNSLKDQEKTLKEQIKIRESILKSGMDMETGEELIKPTRKITEYLTIKIK